MSLWTLIQVVFDLVFLAGMSLVFIRLKRPPQDDPRLSRGLQLLQTKITVLEDLSDRTDAQVKQLTSLLDHKARVVQNKILEAEQQMMKIDHSMNKSLEVAEIFQDKIPHHEILERQRTVEYVKAARMAHSGLSVDEIAKSVPLPPEQIELIAKFNRDELMFDETQLPEWANKEQSGNDEPKFLMSDSLDFMNNLESRPPLDLSSSEKLSRDFKSAVTQAAAQPTSGIMDSKMGETLRTSMSNMQPAVMSIKATAQTLKERLVATAEDLLRQQNAMGHTPMAQQGQAPQVRKITPTKTDPDTFLLGRPSEMGPATVKKVIFPRIDKQ